LRFFDDEVGDFVDYGVDQAAGAAHEGASSGVNSSDPLHFGQARMSISSRFNGMAWLYNEAALVSNSCYP